MAIQQQRERYRESLRQEIIDAARTLFLRDGYEATSVRKIAERVGASPGILYHYFEDKSDILSGIVAETFGKLNTRLEAIWADKSDSLDGLRRGLLAYVHFGLDNEHHYEVAFILTERIKSDNPKVKSTFMSEGPKCFDHLRRIVARCIDEGLLRSELKDMEEVAQVLWSGIHGVTSLLITNKGFPFIERTRLVNRLVDVLIEGVRRRT